MKIGIVNTQGENKSVWDHTLGNELNNIQGCEAIMFDDPMIDDHSLDMPAINSCVGVQNLVLNEELREGVFEQIGITKACDLKFSTLYGLFNGEKFSDLMEVSYSSRFMTGDIGPKIGFAHGTGIKVKPEVYEAFPQLGKVRDFLSRIEYRGEVLLEITKDYCVQDIRFGHFFAHFAMYSEICKNTTQDMLMYMLGLMPGCELYDSLCVSNLVSAYPFPSMGLNSKKIHAPKGAEKHLWRLPRMNGESVLITCHGNYLKEARKRIRRTIDNLVSFDRDLQYRIDYGLRPEFVLVGEQYTKFETTDYQPSDQSIASHHSPASSNT